MSTELGWAFGTKVLGNYATLQESRLRKSALSEALTASAAQIRTGHPMFEDLGVGQQRSCEMVSVFLDLTNFTGRTFWDDQADVSALAHAVLSGFTDVVTKLGGHVLGLRGDGLFASFGPTHIPAIEVAVAATACAAALDGVRNHLNPMLLGRGIEPVIARAGADFGTATFVRSGTNETSEINVIGFASNFAAKCEKSAAAWQLVVGQGFADHIASKSLLLGHEDSPKRYTRKGVTQSYSFFQCSWDHLLSDVDSTVSELGGNPLELITI